MCWPHVFRNINPYILKLKKINENLATELIRDIEDLQNLVTNEHNFRKAYGILEQEYISKSSDISFTEFSSILENSGLTHLYLDGGRVVTHGEFLIIKELKD